MSNKIKFQTLFTYHWHTTQHLITCAAKLDETDYTAEIDYGRDSIHDLLFHILQATQGWRLGLETGQQPYPLKSEDFSDIHTLQAACKTEEAAWQIFLDKLSDKEIDSDINLTTLRGDVWAFPRWRILQHLILHGMQHHSELAQLLTLKGQSPGDIDFIFFQG